MADVLARYRVDCVVDVGANRGQTGRRLRRLGYRGSIVSFEPVPRAFEELAREAANDRAWSVHQLALGREDGTTTMNVVPGTLSSLREPTEFACPPDVTSPFTDIAGSPHETAIVCQFEYGGTTGTSAKL